MSRSDPCQKYACKIQDCLQGKIIKLKKIEHCALIDAVLGCGSMILKGDTNKAT